MRRFVGIVMFGGFIGAAAYAIRRFLLIETDDPSHKTQRQSDRADLRPIAYLERSDPDVPPHKAAVEPKKAEPPKPAGAKAARPKAATADGTKKAAAKKTGGAKKVGGTKKAPKKPPSAPPVE